jgi:hypothetical protein
MPKKNAPPAPIVPLDVWRELYQAAADFQVLAPWRWMDDRHILGINNERGVRLVSVLGNIAEVFGLASYRGSAGANFLLRLRRREFAPENPDACFYQDALLADFVPRNQLPKEAQALVRELDFQPPVRKPKLYPEFLSYKPGYVPWHIDESEARLLLDDLRKSFRFAELLQAQPTLFDCRQENEFPFFPIAVAEPLTIAQFEWHIVAPIPLAADQAVDPRDFDLPPLLALPRPSGTAWELTAFYSPQPIGEPPRPYFPKMALGVDAASGMVLAFELGTPNKTMAQAAALGLVKSIQASGCRPVTIRVDSASLFRTLRPMADALGAKLVQVTSLRMAVEARRSLEAFSQRS